MDDNVILVENKLASLFAAAALSVAGAHGGTKPHTNSGVPTRPPLIEKPVVKAKSHSFLTEPILAAIAKKESAGKKHIKKLDINNKWSYGDYQIQQDYLHDANEEMGTHYTVADVRFKPEIAKKVVRAYTTKWAREFEHDTGKKPTLRQVIAMHQGGGPAGWKSAHSLAYADDILKKVKQNDS